MIDVPTKPAGSCKHRPIHNGLSWRGSHDGTVSELSARCGYCRAVVELDEEWIEKFRNSKKAWVLPESLR